jgi:tetratricopeptide (TPR) repeat protein
MRCELESANRDEVDEQLAATRQILEQLPHAGLRWTHAYDTAVQALLAGDLAQAERLATEALHLGMEAEQPDAFTIYGSQMLNILVRRGRLAELIPLIEQTVADMPGQAVYLSVLAMAYAGSGDLTRCRGLLDTAHAGDAISSDNSWSSAMYCWADAAVRTGHRAAAEVLHSRLDPFRDHLVTTHVTVDPVVSHTLARLERLLGRRDNALESFRRAHRLHTDLRCPAFVALTEAAWAEWLADRGEDTAHAWTMAERARRVASAGGYAGIERDAVTVRQRLA